MYPTKWESPSSSKTQPRVERRGHPHMNWEDGQKIKIKTSKALFGLVKEKFLISRKEDFVRETKYLSLHNNITGNFCFQKKNH